MSRKFLRKRFLAFVPAIVFLPLSAIAQTAPTTSQPPAAQRVQTPQVPTPTQADILRGAYGPYRANNDLLYYHLTVRVDPEEKSLKGKNTIRFRMLKDATRIQMDLQEPLEVDKILLGTKELKYQRNTGAVFIDFPE